MDLLDTTVHALGKEGCVLSQISHSKYHTCVYIIRSVIAAPLVLRL